MYSLAFKVLVLTIVSPYLWAQRGSKLVSKVDRQAPVFAVCNDEQEKPTYHSGLWFKWVEGRLYIAKKVSHQKTKLTMLEGECLLEPNFIR